jgi:nucleotide-binding universal stress UspA family protein
MIRKILVPLDGTHRAETILPYVEEMAHCFEASVVFLEVIEPVPVVMDGTASAVSLQINEMKALEDQGRLYLAARAGEFRQKGIRAETRLLYGPVVDAILKQAEAESADMIAMASHGRQGLERIVFGSVAEGVLHQAKTALLLIRARD